MMKYENTKTEKSFYKRKSFPYESGKNSNMILGKTIQIFLPDGNPRSMKIAEITSRTVQVILVPRSKLELAVTRSELHNVGLYFLLGNPRLETKSLLYIGEAENCLARLKQHNKSKDFWDVALAVVSRTQHFTKTHVKFLEWFCCKEATLADRYRLGNSNLPSEPHTPEPVQADLIDNFETIKTLVATLGHPIFEQIKRPPSKEILVCQTKNIFAEGKYTEDGLVVFAGSQCRLEETKSASTYIKKLRQKLVEEEVLIQEDTLLKFTSDYIFPSPSSAAATVLGHPANGWRSWKYQDGRTLEAVHR